MLRVVVHQSAAAARQYYTEGLQREDYYSQGQEIVGKWYGKAAAKLGLSDDVSPEAFAALVENRHPVTGDKLTPRMSAKRRVGYDINFHAPKSLSILQALMGDDRIVQVFREAVQETMNELEEKAATRVRKGGEQDARRTGNLAWAEFVHFTARPVGGVPDPHLHVHCFAFNATFDETEKRWKAAEFHDLKQDAPYCEAAFHARLAAKVAKLGYGIERGKTGWEVAGMPRSLIEKFSRRTAQIEQIAREKGISDAKQKDGLGARTRESKRRGFTHAELLGQWGARLTDGEKALLAKLRDTQVKRSPVRPAEALDYAFEKLFSKNSVVVQNRLVAEALKYGVGGLAPEQVWRELSKREMIVRQIGGEILTTSLEVLAEEVALIDFVRSGRGKHAPIKKAATTLADTQLSREQRNAVRHLLRSTDQVIAIRGGAGVGKTTLMLEAREQIEAAGLRIFAFAPSAAASRQTLREAGFSTANTVAHLLYNKELQQRTQGQVIWIDEAGLLGVRELWQVMQIAGAGTRVILTGDSGQHAPVARGDAFRLLQYYAGLLVAEVTQIRRQQLAGYKKAVAALSRGDLKTAFRRLDELGAITEIQDDGERYRLLAKDFIELGRKGTFPLVVSPTHAEGGKVTEAIRDALRQSGQLKGERSFTRYHDLQWENADKKRPELYREGLIVQFHQNARGIQRGERFEILRHTEAGEVWAKSSDGRQVALPLGQAERFQVFEARIIEVGKGERIKITRNGASLNGRRLHNGDLLTVKELRKNGNILLANGVELDAEHGHLTHGYCQTSHSSQSRSVKHVLVAQSEKSFIASSREQFYVSVSRGKESLRIFTDNLAGLQKAVGDTSARRSGLELAGIKPEQIPDLSTELNSRQWRDAVKSRVAGGDGSHHVKTLLEARRQDGPKKESAMSWRQYVEMRRGLVGADGKSRSKGHPQPAEKRGGSDLARKRRSFLRPTELSRETKEKMKAQRATNDNQPGKREKPAKPKAPKAEKPRIKKAADALRSSAKHLREVLSRDSSQKRRKTSQPEKAVKQQKPAPQKSKPRSGKQTLTAAAKHRVKEKQAQPKKAAGAKVKQATPRPPIPKK